MIFDNWKTKEPDEPTPVAQCDICGCPLYEGDRVYIAEGVTNVYVCTECMIEEFTKIL